MKKSFVRGSWQKSRAFSPAVITEGGKAIWIAGHTGQHRGHAEGGRSVLEGHRDDDGVPSRLAIHDADD